MRCRQSGFRKGRDLAAVLVPGVVGLRVADPARGLHAGFLHWRQGRTRQHGLAAPPPATQAVHLGPAPATRPARPQRCRLEHAPHPAPVVAAAKFTATGSGGLCLRDSAAPEHSPLTEPSQPLRGGGLPVIATCSPYLSCLPLPACRHTPSCPSSGPPGAHPPNTPARGPPGARPRTDATRQRGGGRGGCWDSPVAPAKTSPWAGLSEMTAVASTVDARSKVSAPEVAICPEGVTVTEKQKCLLYVGPRPGAEAHVWT